MSALKYSASYAARILGFSNITLITVRTQLHATKPNNQKGIERGVGKRRQLLGLKNVNITRWDRFSFRIIRAVLEDMLDLFGLSIYMSVLALVLGSCQIIVATRYYYEVSVHVSYNIS
ncbi:hypothetical protein J3E72DRAFT_266892 [Bipolaris maydis]|nr:hypothetical protein J3E72DRAFT_266892 [Bipolaris maydis]